MMDDATKAPERIWANYKEANRLYVAYDMPPRDEFDDCRDPYILATPAALAASPEVQALIREAEARGMERVADTIDQMSDAIDALIDEIEIFWGMKQSPSRKLMAMAEAVRDRLFRRAGHIPGNARAETARIRAEAAALRGEKEPK